MIELNFTYNRKIIPYVRMTQRGKYVKEDAIKYLASKENLAWFLKEELKGSATIPDKTPFEIRIMYFAPNVFQFDIDNIVKAVLDAAQGIVFKNDCWCQCIGRAVKYRDAQYKLVIQIKEFDS